MTTKGRRRKPFSAYNIFFRFQSKRLREKERCREKIISHFARKSSLLKFGVKERPNATLLIAQQWKTNGKDFRSYFESQRKELLEDYTNEVAMSAAKMGQGCFQDGRDLRLRIVFQRALLADDNKFDIEEVVHLLC